MRAVLIASLAAAAVAAPGYAHTKTEVVNVYTTVYEGESTGPTEAPAAPAQEEHKGWWGGWGKGGDDYSAPAAPVEAAPVESAPAPSYGGGEETSSDYATAVVQHHNAHRANHSAPALTWDDNLASIAQQTASKCVYAHDTKTGGGGYGQNIAAGTPPSNVSSVITELFYNNEVNNFAGLFGQSTPSNINDESAFDGWGHFSQIVWKGTEKIGCATFDCSGQGLANTGGNVPPYFTVCNYSPAGNFLGEFVQNVGQSLGHPSISWAST